MLDFSSSPLVVGIVHTAGCLERLTEEQLDLSETGIDLLELRLDILPDCPTLKQWPLPVIATARDPKEGGLNHLTLWQRQELIKTMLPSVAAIDIELRSIKEWATIITRAREAQRSVILSYHNFQTVPSLMELQNLASRAHDAGATLLKVAAMTTSEQELTRLLEFQQLTHPLPIATMGMGPLGKKSRLRLATAGSALVYGWLYEPLIMMPPSTQWSARELVQKVK